MNLQKLMSKVRRACEDYDMIQANEKISVAISGGKDSLATLMALAAMRRFYPKPYTLSAITVDLGLEGFDTSGVRDLCDRLDIPYTVIKTDIAKIIFDDRAESNPCSLCAQMRKGALNAEALKQGCTRVAYGHNRDDIIQTFFLSLFYEGRIHSPLPVTYLDRTHIHVIRPLIYVPEMDVVGFAKKYSLPVVKSPCPIDGYTKREAMKHYVSNERTKYKDFDSVIFTAIKGMWGPVKIHSKRKGNTHD